MSDVIVSVVSDSFRVPPSAKHIEELITEAVHSLASQAAEKEFTSRGSVWETTHPGRLDQVNHSVTIHAGQGDYHALVSATAMVVPDTTTIKSRVPVGDAIGNGGGWDW